MKEREGPKNKEIKIIKTRPRTGKRQKFYSKPNHIDKYFFLFLASEGRNKHSH